MDDLQITPENSDEEEDILDASRGNDEGEEEDYDEATNDERRSSGGGGAGGNRSPYLDLFDLDEDSNQLEDQLALSDAEEDHDTSGRFGFEMEPGEEMEEDEEYEEDSIMSQSRNVTKRQDILSDSIEASLGGETTRQESEEEEEDEEEFEDVEDGQDQDQDEDDASKSIFDWWKMTIEFRDETLQRSYISSTMYSHLGMPMLPI